MRIVAAADALGDTGGAGSHGVGKELPVITRGERKRDLSSHGQIPPKMSNSQHNVNG